MTERDATHQSNKRDALFDCLRGDREGEALGLIASMGVTTLSSLRFPYAEKDIFTVLMVAVMRGQMRVVKVLLKRGVDMNAGRLSWHETYRYTLINTPLLYAISSENNFLLDLLLENGADPLYDIKTFLNVSNIPFLSALGKGGYIFHRIIKYSNVFTEFGCYRHRYTCNKHTCLCYAISYHLDKYVSPESFQFIQKIIQKGGIVCSGHSGNSIFGTGTRTCSQIYQCLAKKVKYLNDGTVVNECLSLVCSTDYVHENSTLYCTLKTFTDTIMENDGPAASDELRKASITWLANVTKQPSTLKHICRVHIRRFIPGLCIEAVKTLPLPTELIDYINVVNKK